MHSDRLLFDYFYAAVPPWVSVPITDLCTWGALWVLVGAGLSLFGRGADRQTGLLVLLGLTVSHVLVDLTLKPMVGRVRPCAVLDVRLFDTMTSPQSGSFPSGHASLAFAGAWIVSARFRGLRPVLLVLATLIALSRVVVGAHWPSDVVVGSIFGLAIGIGITKAFGITRSAPLQHGAGEAVAGVSRRREVDGSSPKDPQRLP